MLSVSERSYRRLLASNRAPGAAQVLQLTRELKLDPERLARGEVDMAALLTRHRGPANELPEVYSVAAYSKRRTSLHLLSYLERQLGPEAVDELLWRFDLDHRSFKDPDGVINLRFLTDLTGYLARKGATPDLLFDMGANAARVNRDSELGILLRSCESVPEAYDLQVNHLMGHYDRNFRYRLLSLTESHCVIECRERSDVTEALRVRHLGSSQVCEVKLGVSGAVTAYLGLPVSRAVETHCVHRGDATCRYLVDFAPAAAELRRRALN